MPDDITNNHVLTKPSEVLKLISNIVPKKNRRVLCPNCDVEFKNKTICGHHIKYKYYRHIFPYFCDDCEMAWTELRSRDDHNIKFHDPNNSIPKYEKISELEVIKQYKDIIHEDDTLICPICKIYKNNNLNLIKRHMKDNHIEYNDFHNENIKLKSEALSLITVHENEYHECPICLKIFDSHKGCASHISQQHPHLENDLQVVGGSTDNNEENISDEILEKIKNMSLKEAQDSLNIVDGIYYCYLPTCRRYKTGLSNRDSYRKHVRSHFDSEYKFKCELCPDSHKGFMLMCELNKHKRRNHLSSI
jgi:hypothetical protein